MSIQAVSWCLGIEDENLKPVTRFVLTALANYADETGACWPSQETLAKNTGMTARAVRKHMRILEEAGYIARTHRQRADGSRNSDIIRICFSNRNIVPVDPIQPEQTCNPTGTNVQIQPEHCSGKPSYKPSIEEPSDPPSSPPVKKPVGKRRRVPPDWTPDDTCRAYAAEKGNTDGQISDLAEAFRDYHVGKGTLFADITAGWRGWVRRDIEFNGAPAERGGGGRGAGGDVAAFAQALDELEALPEDHILRRI